MFPRSYIDVNRAADDLDPAILTRPAAFLKPRPVTRVGLVRRHAQPGVPIYDRKLGPDDVLARIERYHTPYHRVLDETCDAAASRIRRGLAYQLPFDAVLRQPPREGARASTADFVLGDRDGTTCEPDFTDFVARFLRGLGYDVRVNEGYKGVEIVRRQGRPAERRHSLQIEVDRALYMDQKTLEKLPGFDRLQADLAASGRGGGRVRAFPALASDAWRLMNIEDLRARQLHPLFAGEVVGVDVGRPLDAGNRAGVSRRRSTATRCWCCAARISTTSGRWRSRGISASWNCRAAVAPMSPGGCGPKCPTSRTSTRTERLRGRDDPRRFDQLGNRLWHTDGSFRRVPAALSMLYAHRVPGRARSARRNRIRRFARRL